jgi:hypothetical protein
MQRRVSIVLFVLLSAPAAWASDGRLEINDACAATGCFPGDAPGYPVTISTRGSYVLTSNLTIPSTSTSGIVMQTTSVSLDLNGFTVAGPVTCSASSYYEPSTITCTGSGNGDGVSMSAGSRVHGGRVVGAGRYGISAGGSLVSPSVVEDVRVEQNAQGGIYLNNGTVRRAEVSMNGAAGILNIAAGDASAATVIEDSNISINKGAGISLSALIRNVRITYNGGAGIVMVFAGGNNLSVNDSFIQRNDGNAINGLGSYRGNEIRSNGTTGGGQVIGGITDAGGNVVH